MTFLVEPATEGDLNFIRSSWIRSFADSHMARHAGQAYWPGHTVVRDRLMAECPPIVARMEGEPTSICGWACFGPDVVHYVFVRPRWQRLGVAKLLLEPLLEREGRVFYTHKTHALSVREENGNEVTYRSIVPDPWIYNPYMALNAPKVA